LRNSASNPLDETPKNFAPSGIYNSTGQLLKGNKFFGQYTELATQLDTKRSAFYLKSKENGNEVIFGCSLSVKADNGREERVVFIQAYKNLYSQTKVGSDIHLLKQFSDIQSLKHLYERVESEVESPDLKKYSLIGLWDKEDFKHIREIKIEDDVLEYTAGKICAGKKVSVKISELSSGLSLVLRLIERLRYRCTFSLDVSQYPSETGVSLSLIKPISDFEIGENGKCRAFSERELWNFYRELGEEFLENETFYSKGSQTQSDSVSPVVNKILSYSLHHHSLLSLILNEFDDKEKVEIFQGLVKKATTISDPNIRKVLKATTISDPNIRKVLIDIYSKIESTECRKDLYKTLISKNVYIEDLIKDLIIDIYKEHDNDLFNLLFNNTSLERSSPKNSGSRRKQNSLRDSKYSSFKEGVVKALEFFEYSDKVDFVKFIATEAPPKPKDEGRVLLETLIEDMVNLKGNDFVLKLSEKEAENLDQIQGSDYLETKKILKKRKRSRNIKIIFYTSALVIIIITASYFYIYLAPSLFLYLEKAFDSFRSLLP